MAAVPHEQCIPDMLLNFQLCPGRRRLRALPGGAGLRKFSHQGYGLAEAFGRKRRVVGAAAIAVIRSAARASHDFPRKQTVLHSLFLDRGAIHVTATKRGADHVVGENLQAGQVLSGDFHRLALIRRRLRGAGFAYSHPGNVGNGYGRHEHFAANHFQLALAESLDDNLYGLRGAGLGLRILRLLRIKCPLGYLLAVLAQALD